MVHVSTFNPEIIRNCIEGTSVLEKGVRYMKAINPGVSDEVAKETAIRQAQQFCQAKWQNDRTGYISNEYIAYQEFASDVEKGRYFNAPSATRKSSDRDWFLFIICLLFGVFGAHRFIDGQIGTGLLWLCTGGLFGIGWIVDLVNIWKGNF